MLPIVRRELQVTARKRSLYWQRSIIGSLAAIFGVGFILFSHSTQSEIGRTMFRFLSSAVFILTLLDGIRCAGDAISSEKREGTLGLLFLTDLQSYDIVLGKFCSGTIKAMTPLLATFPVLALPLLLGGVTFGEWARTILTLVITALFSLSTALLCSSLTRSALVAMVGVAILLTLSLFPIIARPFFVTDIYWIWISGPFGMMTHSSADDFQKMAPSFWKAAAVSLIYSGAMLATTCWITRRLDESLPKSGSLWWKRFLEPKPALARTFSETTSKESPELWLARRTLPGSRYLWLLTLLGAALSCWLAITLYSPVKNGKLLALQLGFCILIKLWLGIIAPQSLHAARTSGALELLLCTPLQTKAIVQGQLEALRRYILPPGLVVCIGYPFLSALAGGLFNSRAWDSGSVMIMTVLGIFCFIILLLDFHGLAYTGLWYGLSCRKIEQAVARTIGYVLVLPWLLVILPIVGWMVLLFWSVYWIFWATQKLETGLREKVATQFSESE